ncbi:MAG: GNAT family N-acetyltransferase [Crocosphaera sp.]|nr:GNAT family N-acetyltransferase [Crocosphaera sp.]
MNTAFTYKPLEDSQEAKKLAIILGQCFAGFQEDQWEKYYENIGFNNFRILCQDETVIGGLRIYYMGQYFGGKSIPMAGIAAVGISPEYRGKKAATTLMKAVLKELYEDDIPLSTLYPAIQKLYRGVGYDQGGVHCQWEVPLTHLSVNNRVLPIEKIEDPQPNDFEELYQQQAQQNNGYLDRSLSIWKSILNADKGTIYAYLIGEEDNRQGYLIYEQVVINYEVYLKVKDWVALNHLAIERLWTFIADHRSQVSKCQWKGPFYDHKMLLLPEQSGHIISHDIWFTRIINAVKALEMRPYPNQMETELQFSLEDTLITDNSSNFKLQISKGKGNVIRGGNAEIKLNIQSLASLYTGFSTAKQLYYCGKLEASELNLDILQQVFALPMPSLPDFF